MIKRQFSSLGRVMVSLSRNLLDNVKTKCKELSTLTNDPSIQAWINSTFKNWVQNEAPANSVSTLGTDAPEWAREAMQNNDLYTVDWTAVVDILKPIIEYFQYLNQQGTKFTAMAVPEAIQQQTEYHAKLAAKMDKQSSIIEDGMTPILTFPNGYFWAKLTGRDSLDREGDIMGHCVGSYYDDVKAGHKTVYSLRDPDNGPHITVEVEGDKIRQIKGKANKEVVARYRDYIPPFLGSRPFDSIYLDECGIPKKKIVKYFQDNKLFRAAESGKPILSIALTSNVVNVYGRMEADDAEQNQPRPIIYDRDEHGGQYTGFQVLIGVADSVNKPIQVPEVSGKTLDYIIQKLELENVSAADRLTLYVALTGKYPHMLHASRGDAVLLKEATRKVKGFKSGFTYREPIDREQASIVLGQDFDMLLTYKDTPLLAIAKNRVEWFIKGLPLKTWTAEENAAFSKHLSKFDISRTPKAFQAKMHIKSVEQAGGPKIGEGERGAGISYKNVKPDLLKAINVFAGGRFSSAKFDPKTLSHELDVGDIKSILKASKLRASGYLYEFFDTFFYIALMSDKAKAAEYILKTPGLLRLFTAFVSEIGSLRAGIFWSERAQGKAGVAKLEKAYPIINANMPKLFPLSQAEKDMLMNIRGTPRFKKTITERF